MSVSPVLNGNDDIDQLALLYARQATATLSAETIEVFPDGAICDRHLYDLFVMYRNAVLKAAKK